VAGALTGPLGSVTSSSTFDLSAGGCEVRSSAPPAERSSTEAFTASPPTFITAGASTG
jgi:hypothetical protein